MGNRITLCSYYVHNARQVITVADDVARLLCGCAKLRNSVAKCKVFLDVTMTTSITSNFGSVILQRH